MRARSRATEAERVGTKYTTKWGVQIAGMIFGAGSSLQDSNLESFFIINEYNNFYNG